MEVDSSIDIENIENRNFKTNDINKDSGQNEDSHEFSLKYFSARQFKIQAKDIIL